MCNFKRTSYYNYVELFINPYAILMLDVNDKNV